MNSTRASDNILRELVSTIFREMSWVKSVPSESRKSLNIIFDCFGWFLQSFLLPSPREIKELPEINQQILRNRISTCLNPKETSVIELQRAVMEIGALAPVADIASFNALQTLLNYDNETVRIVSCQSLGRIGGISAKERLLEALKDSNQNVRTQAQHALCIHTFGIMAQLLRDHYQKLNKGIIKKSYYEVTKARRIQEPLVSARIKDLGFDIEYVFEPCQDVGGDYLEIRQIVNDRIFICVGDVSGHGIPAALCANMLKPLITLVCGQLSEPKNILAYLNETITDRSLDEDFITMILVLIDPDRGGLCYASAGHEPAYLIGRGETSVLNSTGPPLGIDKTYQWESKYIKLNGGELLALTTDGIVECVSPQGELLGRDKLRIILEKNIDKELKTICQQIVSCVHEHSGHTKQKDDITLLLARFFDKT